MKIGFNFSDIKVGGQYHDQFLNQMIKGMFTTADRFRPVEQRVRRGNICFVEMDDVPPYNWFANNHENIEWDSLTLLVDAPISVKTNLVPAWFPNPYVLDEQGEPTTQRKTFDEYGIVVRESLDGQKCLIKVLPEIIPNSTEFAKIVTTITNKPTWTAYTYGDVQQVLEADYNANE